MITAAADGSSLANPGPAGWAWYIDDQQWAAGGWPQATNNQAELMAVLDLLHATAHIDDELRVLCDSQYVINSLTKWMAGWKRRGWRKADNKPVENLELMKQLDQAIAGRRVSFEWVKGHAGHPLNEAADERARAAATSFRDGTQVNSGPGFPSSSPAESAPPQPQPDLFSEPTLFDQAPAGSVDSAEAPGLQPAHLELLVSLGQPSLDPTGSHAVYAVRRPSLAADSYVSRLWMVPTSGERPPRPLTHGLADWAPQFSPDGQHIAFLRGTPPQLAVVEAPGGEPRILTDAPLGVEEFVWSRDSRQLAFVARIPEAGRYGTLAGVSAEREDPRRITGNQFQANGVGYTRDRPRGIYLLDVPAAEQEPWIEPVGRAADGLQPSSEADLGGTKGLPAARLLTPTGADCYQPEFAPDDSAIYFTAALHEGRDEDIRSMIHRVPLRGGNPQLIAGGLDSQWGWSRPRFSRSGQLWALGLELGPSGKDFVGRPRRVARLLPDAQPNPVTGEELDYETGSGFLLPYGADSMLAVARVRGSYELHIIDPTGRVEQLVQGRQVISAAVEAGGTVVAVHSTPTQPAELVRIDGGLTRLTDLTRALLAQAQPIEPSELTITGADGQPVHGWVFLPPGPGPHPVLLNIHGGPFHCFDWGFFDEAQIYAAAGYAVVQCNPRGSASYGLNHGRAVKHRLGSVDMDDVLAFLDGACAANSSLDRNRIGIMGGSYGGYLTAWTISQDHRFTAAIVERGYLDPAAFVGTSDIGWFFSDEYVGTDPARIQAQSPYAQAAQVRTPTLVIHSEQDLRCPLDQAQRYFAALRRAGVATEMLVFPGENHELSRSGSPWHRTQRFQAILEWWQRHLPVKDKGGS